MGSVKATRKALLDAGRMIKSIRKSGYQVVEPDDYTTHAVRQVVDGAKKIGNGVKIMDIASVKDMTPEGVASYNRVNDSIRILHASVTGAKVELKMLEERRQNPLRQAAES